MTNSERTVSPGARLESKFKAILGKLYGRNSKPISFSIRGIALAST